jgi:hypothetical protein
LRVVNKGCYILLVATDLLSQKLSVIAFPNKSQASWERGITQFITRDFPCVQTIITDRWVYRRLFDKESHTMTYLDLQGHCDFWQGFPAED